MPTTNVIALLSAQEQTRKSELVAVVKRGMATFVEVGRALQEIRDGKLYRDSHKTFDAFCESEFEIKRAHAYRLIEAASVDDNLSPTGDKNGQAQKPKSERQTRELAKAPPEEQAEVWQEAVTEANGEQPTAAQVKAAVERKTKPPEPEIVRDPLGVPMPAYLLPVFDGLALFKEADSLCRKLQEVIEQLSTNPAGAVFRRELETSGKSESAIKHRHKSLQQIKSDLKLSRPYTRCPYCASRENGKAFKDCKQCRGMGWATKMTFDSAPADYRAAVEKVK